MQENFEFKTPEDVANRLKKFRFKKRMFGGVDEANVWEGIGKLDEYYQQVYQYEQAEYESLLKERDAVIRKLQMENKKLKEMIRREEKS